MAGASKGGEYYTIERAWEAPVGSNDLNDDNTMTVECRAYGRGCTCQGPIYNLE